MTTPRQKRIHIRTSKLRARRIQLGLRRNKNIKLQRRRVAMGLRKSGGTFLQTH